jgi:type IV pilus assembly protein PilM
MQRALAAPSFITRWFPTPAYLAPRAIGVDISDTSVKWTGLRRSDSGGFALATYGSLPIPSGVIIGGLIRDVSSLATVLRDVKIQSKATHAHAALPEEEAYVFSTHVPGNTARTQVQRLIEFEFEGRVPIPPDAAVFDYDVIEEHTTEGMHVGVTVFPKEQASQYAQAFELAGFSLLSLEIEARSIGRVLDDGDAETSVTLLVDFGRARTGFAVLKHGVPIFTSTVEFGHDATTRAISNQTHLSDKEIERIRNDEGLFAQGQHDALRKEFQKVADGLAEEILKHFRFWDTRRDEHGERVTPVGRVVLVGGSANMKGLVDLVASKVQARTERADIWRHILDVDGGVPPIDKRTSLQFATAAGLALRTV